MATVVDVETGAEIEVPDDAAMEMVATGRYRARGRLNAKSALGGTTSVTQYQLDRHSLTPYTTEDEYKDARRRRLTAEHDTFGGEVKAFLGGAADAVSLGLIDGWKDEREVNPYASGAGNVAGIASTLLIPGAGAASAARGGSLAVRALRAEQAAAGAVMEASSLARAGSAIGKVVGYTPLGLATRAGSYAGSAVKGGGLLGAAASTAVEGAVGGAAMDVGRAILDDDHELSGEALLGSIAMGGGIGAAGSLASAGIGKVRSLGKAKQVDEAAMLTKHRPVDAPVVQGTTTWGNAIKVGGTKNGAAMADAVSKNVDDLGRLIDRTEELMTQSGLLGGLKRADLEHGLRQAKAARDGYQAFIASPQVANAQIMGLSKALHGADELAMRLRTVTNDLPARWADDALRARLWDDVGSRLGRKPGQLEDAAERIGAQLTLGLGKEAAGAAKGGLLRTMSDALLSKVPGGKYIQGGVGGAGALMAVEQVISHGVGSLVGTAATAGAGAIAAGLAAKAVQAAFKDPRIGGLLSAHSAHVLRRSGLIPGDKESNTTDPRRALREFADRTRRISPEAAAKHAVEAAGGSAAMSPVALAKVGELAAQRHRMLQDMIERVDPRAASGGQLLGRPLPSEADARRVADFLKASGSPVTFIVAALDGRLTPELMAAAEQLWPSTVAKVRQELLGALANVDPDSIPTSRIRALELILGPQALGGPSRSEYYRQVMADAAASTSEVKPPQPPTPTASIGESPSATPAMRAARPGQDR